MRYFFEVAYKGTEYHGWQSQPNAISVQEVLEEKLTTYFRQQVEITGSGRTDAGVHCEQQYFHTDLSESVSSDDLFKLNSFLPQTIRLINYYQVDSEKHARFDALSRRYHYKILLKGNPFLLDTATSFYKPLDIEKMKSASQLLIGEQDFQCFSKVKTDVKTYICNVHSAEWVEENGILVFDITANRFLRGMVRAIVGTLLEVGEEKRTIEDFRLLLESGDRTKAGAAAPAKGLTLKEVRYPANYFN